MSGQWARRDGRWLRDRVSRQPGKFSRPKKWHMKRRIPSKKSWTVGKSSGLRRYLCRVRVMAPRLEASLTTSKASSLTRIQELPACDRSRAAVLLPRSQLEQDDWSRGFVMARQHTAGPRGRGTRVQRSPTGGRGTGYEREKRERLAEGREGRK